MNFTTMYKVSNEGKIISLNFMYFAGSYENNDSTTMLFDILQVKGWLKPKVVGHVRLEREHKFDSHVSEDSACI